MSLNKFAKYLTEIEYPKRKTSWDIAGIIKGQNAFYKFDVRTLIKESNNRAYKPGNFKTKADKTVFELEDRWVVLDIEELHTYIKKHKLKDLELTDLIKKLDWTIEVLK